MDEQGRLRFPTDGEFAALNPPEEGGHADFLASQRGVPEGWHVPTGRSHAWHRRHRNERSGQRNDIQGLRAVAVIAVVINHLFNQPKGGFVGVDVFFVISGFLITSLLLREEGRSGHISLLGFYRRRIRRLLPAGLTVIALTVIAAHYAFISERAHTVAVDGAWTALFAGNWHFLQIGTNYFQSYGPVSPLQHYWSLAVEEQFYAVWPLVLIIVMAVSRRIFRGRRHAVVATGVVGALALTVPSLLFAVMQSTKHPTAAYFSTFTRAWELGFGAIIAVLIPYMRGNRFVLSLLSWVGLGMIGASFALVSQHHFPYPGALLPTLGAVLVVVAKSPTARALNFLLTNRLAVYLGDISYSIYVVHFPVIVILGSLTVQHKVLSHVVVLLATAGASVLLFHVIEDPIRNSSWLEPKRVRATREPMVSLHNRKAATVLGAAAAVIALSMWIVGGISESPQNPYLALLGPAGAATPGTVTSSDGTVVVQPADSTVPPKTQAVQADLIAALQATSWPKISPDFSHPTDKDNHGCGIDTVPPIAQCTFGNPNATHTLYLVGDSTSQAYLPTFVSIMALLPTWKLVMRADAGCPFSTTPVAEDGGAEQTTATQSCTAHNEKVVAEIKVAKPDLAVFTTISGSSERLAGKRDELAAISSSVGKVVVLPAPPPIQNPLECVTAVSKPSDCVTPIPQAYHLWLNNLQGVANYVHGAYLNPTLLFCADGLCPVFVKTIPKTKDGVHMTVDYANYLVPAMHELFQVNKLLP